MHQLVSVALSNAVVATFLAMLAWPLGRWFKCPRCGHLLWILVLAKLVTPPLFDLPLPLLPAAKNAVVAGNASQTSNSVVSNAEVVSNTSGASASSAVQEQQQVDAEQSSYSLAISPGAWLLVIWIVGAVFYGFYQLYVTVQMGRLMQMASPDPRVDRAMHRIARKAKVKNYPTARVVPWVGSPMLWGMGGTSVIVIPEGLFAAISDESADTLLQHELAHFQRGDQWVRILEAITSTLFWWHPVVWIAKGEIEVYEEQCCDAWVVQHDRTNRRRYAEALLDTVDYIAEAPDSSMPLAASGLGRVPLLKQRLKTIMQGDVPAFDSRAKAILIMLLLLLPLRPSLVQANFAIAPQSNTSSLQEPVNEVTQSSKTKTWRQVLVEDVEYALAGATYGTYELVAKTGYNVALRHVVTQTEVSLKDYQIACAAFAPVNPTTKESPRPQFAAGCHDGRVLLFDCESGEVVSSLGDFDHPIHSISYSPDGQQLVVGGEGRLLVLLDLKTSETNPLPVSVDAIRCVRFSAAGDRLVIAEEAAFKDAPTTRVEVRQIEDWQLLRSIVCPQAVGVAELVGNDIVTAAWDGTVRVWSKNRISQVEQYPKDMVSAASFSPNAISLSELVVAER